MIQRQQHAPRAFDVLGESATDAYVTIMFPAPSANITPAQRQGRLFYQSQTVANATTPVAGNVGVTAVKNLAGPNGEDLVAETQRAVFVAKTPETFTHDADGNLTGDARWTYTWDGENRLSAMETSATATSAGVPKQKLEFVYDGQSRRVSKKVYDWVSGAWTLNASQRFVYDGWNLIAELRLNPSTSTYDLNSSYAWGLDLSGSLQGAGGVGGLLFANSHLPTPNFAAYAAAFDGNGNVIGYVDLATGAKSATYEYNAFGETIISDGVAKDALTFRFSTKYTDNETGLLYYGERYKGEHGWINRDPLEESGGLNIYAFVLNDPISFFDTDGREVGSQNPGLAPEGRGSQWRDPATGQFTKPPQLPPPPSSGKVLNLPGSRDAGNSVRGYGSLIISVANELPKATLEHMLKYGRAECQKQQAYTGKGCACCVVRIYKLTSISANLGNQHRYIYGFARVVSGSCDKTKDAFSAPEIVPYYAPADTAMARYSNQQTTVNQFYPW